MNKNICVICKRHIEECECDLWGELKIDDKVCYRWNINRHGTIKRIDTGPKSLYKRIYVQWDDLEVGDLREYWDHDLQLVQ